MFTDLRDYCSLYEKNSIKPFVALEEASCNPINCIQCIVGNVGSRFCEGIRIYGAKGDICICSMDFDHLFSNFNVSNSIV